MRTMMVVGRGTSDGSANDDDNGSGMTVTRGSNGKAMGGKGRVRMVGGYDGGSLQGSVDDDDDTEDPAKGMRVRMVGARGAWR